MTLTRDGRTETLVDADGKVLDPQREYRVTVNSFLASAATASAPSSVARRRLGGALDIDALVDYMARFKAPKPPYTPGTRVEDAGTPRILRVGGSACPTGAETNP